MATELIDTIARLGDGDLARRIIHAPGGQARSEEAELCSRLARRVRLYGLRHLKSEDAASDLVQQVMIITLQKLRAGEVREPNQIGSFVLGVARMVAHERFREEKRVEPLPALHDETDETPAFEAYQPDPIASEHLTRCLEMLAERERTVLVLTYFGDFTSSEVASEVGLNAGNVRVIRHRAIEQMRGCMGFSEEGAR